MGGQGVIAGGHPTRGSRCSRLRGRAPAESVWRISPSQAEALRTTAGLSPQRVTDSATAVSEDLSFSAEGDQHEHRPPGSRTGRGRRRRAFRRGPHRQHVHGRGHRRAGPGHLRAHEVRSDGVQQPAPAHHVRAFGRGPRAARGAHDARQPGEDPHGPARRGPRVRRGVAREVGRVPPRGPACEGDVRRRRVPPLRHWPRQRAPSGRLLHPRRARARLRGGPDDGC